MGQPRPEWLEIARVSAADNGVPLPGLLALINRESDWNQYAYNSESGAMGLGQFMGPTAAEWGVAPWSPASAIDGAARYLHWLRTQLGEWPRALAAYNWGIGNVQNAGSGWRDAMPTQTRNYVAALSPSFAAGELAPSGPQGVALLLLLALGVGLSRLK